MKILILLLSCMFMSGVTANTESRDLSNIGSALGDENIKTAFLEFLERAWERAQERKRERKREYEREQEREQERRLDNCLSDCPRRGCDGHESCTNWCRNRYTKKEGIKVAGIRAPQNLFNQLEEPEDFFYEQLSAPPDKTPLRLADDYYCCVVGCLDEGGSYLECYRICEE